MCAHVGTNFTGQYHGIRNGRCPPGREITSLSECSAAAKDLKLNDQSASSDNQPNGVGYDPPFCYYEGGQLKFNGGRNYGSCTSSDTCLCVGPPRPPLAGENDRHDCMHCFACVSKHLTLWRPISFCACVYVTADYNRSTTSGTASMYSFACVCKDLTLW